MTMAILRLSDNLIWSDDTSRLLPVRRNAGIAVKHVGGNACLGLLCDPFFELVWDGSTAGQMSWQGNNIGNEPAGRNPSLRKKDR